MENHRLNDDLSFCHIDGRLIFLDTRSDRYFRLSSTLEHAFDSYVDGAQLSPKDIAHLVGRNILTDVPSLTSRVRATIPIATRSALELPPSPTVSGIRSVAEVFAIVCSTQFHLKTLNLKKILDDAITRRPLKSELEDDDAEPRLLNETHIFLKARKLVPIETCCLLDSLSMTTFLARRHLHSNIVFGVTDDPFTAHCWVQTGEMILNDAVGNIRAYTAIRVI